MLDAEEVALPGLKGAPARRFQRPGALTRRVIGSLVGATLDETERRLQALGEAPSPGDILAAPEPVVSLPEDEEEQVANLIGFLLERVYRHPNVEMMCDKGRRILRSLY